MLPHRAAGATRSPLSARTRTGARGMSRTVKFLILLVVAVAVALLMGPGLSG